MKIKAYSIIVGAAVLIAACAPSAVVEEPVAEPESEVAMVEEALVPSVSVSDQDFVDGTVTMTNVTSNGQGWIVIHTEKDGGPGPIIGYSMVSDGSNADVVVEIDESQATDRLFAMLHTDAGELGTYEFPGDDAPVKVDDAVVVKPFSVTVVAAMEDDSAMAAEVSFSGDIWPIIDQYALNAHGGKGGVFLESYEDILEQVVPGDPEGSRLYQVLTATNGAPQMPPSGPLPDEMIQLFYDWISQGAPNN